MGFLAHRHRLQVQVMVLQLWCPSICFSFLGKWKYELWTYGHMEYVPAQSIMLFSCSIAWHSGLSRGLQQKCIFSGLAVPSSQKPWFHGCYKLVLPPQEPVLLSSDRGQRNQQGEGQKKSNFILAQLPSRVQCVATQTLVPAGGGKGGRWMRQVVQDGGRWEGFFCWHRRTELVMKLWSKYLPGVQTQQWVPQPLATSLLVQILRFLKPEVTFL